MEEIGDPGSFPDLISYCSIRIMTVAKHGGFRVKDVCVSGIVTIDNRLQLKKVW